MSWILYSSILQLNYGQFWVVGKNLLYRFLKNMHGKSLSSGGTDSQIFIAENYGYSIPSDR